PEKSGNCSDLPAQVPEKTGRASPAERFAVFMPHRLPGMAHRRTPGDATIAGMASDDRSLLQAALAEARTGLAEGGIPIGAAIFAEPGKLLGAGHNRRVQSGDPSMHGETDAFRNAGRRRSYRKLTLVSTLAPCWYCSGLIRQFGFARVVVGESRTYQGGIDWL